MTRAEATSRVRQELARFSADRLIDTTRQVTEWWDRAIGEDDHKAFSTVRNLIFQMNEWLGWEDERVHMENIEGEDPGTLIVQYCSILLALVAERTGDGEMVIDHDAWGSKREICTVGGQPYTLYVKELARLTTEETAGHHATEH
jgi:hypothetical protein